MIPYWREREANRRMTEMYNAMSDEEREIVRAAALEFAEDCQKIARCISDAAKDIGVYVTVCGERVDSDSEVG